MTITPNTALPIISNASLRWLGPIAPRCAANDNAEEALSDMVVRAALIHFARFGLGAAENARDAAERAFFADDREGYDWWMAICRTLDRRIAANSTMVAQS